MRLEAGGEVGSPGDVTAALSGLPRVEQVSDFHCVTTWTARSLRWAGVRYRDFHERVIVPHVRPKPSATFVVVKASDGGRTILPLEHLLAEDVLLADTLNGEPLTVAHGAPLRLVAPAHYGYKNLKHLSRVEYWSDDSRWRPAAFRFMDHLHARVALEERGRGVPGWLLRLLYRPLVKPTIARFARELARHTAGLALIVLIALLACGAAGAAELRGPGEPCEAGASVWMTYRADPGPPGLPFTAKVTSSHPDFLAAPAEIAVRPGRNTLFEVTCRAVSAQTIARISVAAPSPGTAEPEAIASVSTDLVLALPPAVAGLSLGPTVNDGEDLAGRVTLARIVGAGGVEVRFTSSPPGLVDIASIRVRGGESRSDAEFRVIGRKVSNPTTVTITAVVGPGAGKSTTVTVVPPPVPVSFEATPSGGRVTLSGPVHAPLALAVSSLPVGLLNHPSVVIVRSGEDSVDVPFTPTVPVPVSLTQAAVVVEGGGAAVELATTFAWQGTLRFRDATKPAPPFEIGSNGTRRLTIEARPPVGSPLRVELSSASEFVNLPRYVVIESFSGGTSADVKVTASAVTEKKVATLNAIANGRVTAVRIVVSPPQ